MRFFKLYYDTEARLPMLEMTGFETMTCLEVIIDCPCKTVVDRGNIPSMYIMGEFNKVEIDSKIVKLSYE